MVFCRRGCVGPALTLPSHIRDLPATPRLHSLVGYSDNRGDRNGDTRFQRWDAALGRTVTQGQGALTAGMRLYDGPVVLSNVTARSWPAGTAPISLRSFNTFQMAAGSSISGFTASNVTYRVVFQDTSGDGGRTASLLDVDGSVSGYPGAMLLPNSPTTSLGFYSAPGCASHPAYGLACPQRHINLEMGAWDWAGGGTGGAAGVTRANLSPGRTGAAGLAAQRLPTLNGGELGPKASRGGRCYNVKAAVGGSYLLAFGDGGTAGAPGVCAALQQHWRLAGGCTGRPSWGVQQPTPERLFVSVPPLALQAPPPARLPSAPAAPREMRWRLCSATLQARLWAPRQSHVAPSTSCPLKTPPARRRPRSAACKRCGRQPPAAHAITMLRPPVCSSSVCGRRLAGPVARRPLELVSPAVP